MATSDDGTAATMFAAEQRQFALDFLKFLNASPTPFHAVVNCEGMLRDAGFVELDECERFSIRPGDKCYVKKGETTLFAFAVGAKWKPGGDGGGGFSMVATHTDSCCLRLKPVSKRSAEGFLQLGVCPYGGGKWSSWFDRDLSLAGQLVLRHQEDVADNRTEDRLEHKLVDLRRPMLHIPSLAIHLDQLPGNKTEFNLEQHLCPLFACQSSVDENEILLMSRKNDEQKGNISSSNCASCCVDDHHLAILRALAEAADCEPEQIVDMDLFLYDSQPAVLSGLNEEFISGARLDNLVGTYCAIRGLIESLAGGKEEEMEDEEEMNIRLVACYDHEEVGNQSCQGAETATTEWLMRRLCANTEDPCAFERAIGHSFLISADKAHAAHPNYPEKHEQNHRPRFGAGPVVKFNLVNLRFLSTAMTEAVVKIIAEKAGVPLQKYTFRNDGVRGNTIGPVLAARLGIQTVDIGCQPQLAMHSIREFGDSVGIHQSIQLFKAFFRKLPTVLAAIKKMP